MSRLYFEVGELRHQFENQFYSLKWRDLNGVRYLDDGRQRGRMFPSLQSADVFFLIATLSATCSWVNPAFSRRSASTRAKAARTTGSLGLRGALPPLRFIGG
jgi:hypothetical protein